jgi:hypothetical protein
MKNTIKYAFALLALMVGVPCIAIEVTLENFSGKKLETILLTPVGSFKRGRNLGFNREHPVGKNEIIKFTINTKDNPFALTIIDDRGEYVTFPNVEIKENAQIELVTQLRKHRALLKVTVGKRVKQYEQVWELKKTSEEFTFENKTSKTIGRVAVLSGLKEYNVNGLNNPLNAGEHESFHLPISFDLNELSVLVAVEGVPEIFKDIKVSKVLKVLTLTEDAQGKLHLDVHEAGK